MAYSDDHPNLRTHFVMLDLRSQFASSKFHILFREYKHKIVALETLDIAPYGLFQPLCLHLVEFGQVEVQHYPLASYLVYLALDGLQFHRSVSLRFMPRIPRNSTTVRYL